MAITAYDLQTENGDLVFFQGDLSIFDSNKEHVSALMDANKGEWKQYPLIGVDLIRFVNSPAQSTRLELQQEISKQLSDDGFEIQDLFIQFDLRTEKLNIKTNAQRFR